MDFRVSLQKEHSKKQTIKIADYVGFNKARFKQLVEVYLAGPYRITQRAAWPLSLCVERHPELILPHLGRILKHLSRPGVHDAVKRNTVRLLQFIKIPPRYLGAVADLCFRYLSDRKEAIAVRVFSMTVLSNMVSIEPGLREELKLLIEDELPYASAAFRSRGLRTLDGLRKIS
ncbi:MAG TPA: hypothetical protein VF141_08770 [Chryseolinea sp.]